MYFLPGQVHGAGGQRKASVAALAHRRVDEERPEGRQMEFYKSQLMKPCTLKLPCFAVNHFLNKRTLTGSDT